MSESLKASFDVGDLLANNDSLKPSGEASDLLSILKESERNLPEPSKRTGNPLAEMERNANKANDKYPAGLLNGLQELNEIIKLHEALSQQPDAPLIEDLFDEIVACAFDQVDQFNDHFRQGKNSWEKSKLLCLLISVACEEKLKRPADVVDISERIEQIKRFTDTSFHRSVAASIERNMDVVMDRNDVGRFVEAELMDKFLKLDHSLEKMEFIQNRKDKTKIKPIVVGLISSVLKEVSQNVHDAGLEAEDIALSYRSLLSRSHETVCAILSAEFKNGIETVFDEANTKRIKNTAIGLIKSVTLEENGRSTLSAYRDTAQKMYEKFAKANGATAEQIKASKASASIGSVSQAHRINLNQLKVLNWDLTTRQIYQDKEVVAEKSRLLSVLSNTCKYAQSLGGLHSGYVRAKCAEDLMYRACQSNQKGKVFDTQNYVNRIAKVCDSKMFSHFTNAVSVDTKLGHIENSQAYMAHIYLLDSFLEIPVRIQRALSEVGFSAPELESITKDYSKLCIKKQAELEPDSLSKFSVHHALMLKRSLLKFCGENFSDTISRSIVMIKQMMLETTKLKTEEERMSTLRKLLKGEKFASQLENTLAESHGQAMRAVAPYASEIKEFASEERIAQKI